MAGARVIGKRINNYEILQLLGEGGMGAVYSARHVFMERTVAVKVLHAGMARDPQLVQRFLNEARAANAIRHANIIDVFDVGLMPDSEAPYLVMELLEGESLAARIRRLGRLDVPAALAVAGQAAAALAAAHAKGIVHRDLKPENLFVARSEDGTERVKVLDFGIAKLRGDFASSSVRTQPGALMGTPPYMSPEQCQGAADVDARSDVYALGIIMYEMLVGRPPFTAAGFGDIVVMHLMRAPDSPSKHNPAVPAALEAAILRALAKLPGDRFASMDELHAALPPPNQVRGAALAPTEPAMPAPALHPTGAGSTSVLDLADQARGPSTTFRSAAREIVADGRDYDDGDDDLPALRPARRRLLIPAVAGGGLAMLAAGLLFRGGGTVPGASTAGAAAVEATAAAVAPAVPQAASPPVVDAGPPPAARDKRTVKAPRPARARAPAPEKW